MITKLVPPYAFGVALILVVTSLLMESQGSSRRRCQGEGNSHSIDQFFGMESDDGAMELALRMVVERNARRSELLIDLCDGKRTLQEVTNVYIQIDRGSPDAVLFIQRSFPGEPIRIATACSILSRAKDRLSEYPLHYQEFVWLRLNEELNRMRSESSHQ